jgi:hypothetical protein
MSFNFIYNPLINEKYSIFSYEGKSLLKQYIKDYQTGGSKLYTVADYYGQEPIPLNAPQPKRQSSVGTELRKSDEMRNKKLREHLKKQKPKKFISKKTKSKKPTKCDILNEKMDKINEKAQKEIGELRKKYESEGCNKAYNQKVADAFSNINAFN